MRLVADIILSGTDRDGGFCVLWDNGDVQLAFASESASRKRCYLRFRPGSGLVFSERLDKEFSELRESDIDITAFLGLIGQAVSANSEFC